MKPAINFFATCVHPAKPRDRRDGCGVRVSSVLEGLSHALDLTEGHPRGHAVRSCLIGMRLGAAVGLDAGDRTHLLYSLLLKDAGCSSNASIVFDVFGGNDQEAKRAVWLRDWRRLPAQFAYACEYIGRGGSIAARLRKAGRLALLGRRGTGEKIFAVRCERGARIARMLGLPEKVAAALRTMDEHWDGGGYPYGVRGDAAPLLGRIVGLAQVMEIFWARGGPQAALGVAGERRGRWFDPDLVDALLSAGRSDAFWAGLANARIEPDVTSQVPPDLEIAMDDERLDLIADAFALIIDAKSSFTFDHSRRVAGYALAINERLGGQAVDPVRLRRAALLHDIGKLTVPNRILDKPGPLDQGEWSVIRRHPASTQSILERVPTFSGFAADAAHHHEWIDGGGYAFGISGKYLSTTARILAVADVVDALTADRPYRQGMPPERVHGIITESAGSHLDPACVGVCSPDLIARTTAAGVTERDVA
jgi:putative nucleotidyltransferase with HDIG domain